MKTTKIKRPSHKAMKTYCDTLWALCIKARAGFKSELSGKTDRLNAHHLRGKANYAMRYSLMNGFCCTAGEHIFGFHNTGRCQSYENKVRELRGKDIFDKIELLNSEDGVKLEQVRATLENELQLHGVDFSHIKIK